MQNDVFAKSVTDGIHRTQSYLKSGKKQKRERKTKLKTTTNSFATGSETAQSPAKPLPWAHSPERWVLTAMVFHHILP